MPDEYEDWHYLTQKEARDLQFELIVPLDFTIIRYLKERYPLKTEMKDILEYSLKEQVDLKQHPQPEKKVKETLDILENEGYVEKMSVDYVRFDANGNKEDSRKEYKYKITESGMEFLDELISKIVTRVEKSLQ